MDSLTPSDKSAVNSFLIGSPPRVQPCGELSPNNLALSSFSPTSKSFYKTFPSLTTNKSKSNDQSLVNACASGGSNLVIRCSLLDQGQGSSVSAGRSVPDSPLISDQRRVSQAPLGATGVLPCKQSGTSGSVRRERPSRAWVALNVITDFPEHSKQVILTSNDPNRKLPSEVKLRLAISVGK